MYDIFKNILQFNIQACFIILAIIVLRLLLRKAPRSLICALWSLVAVRLVIPFKIQSIFSLTPDTEAAARSVGSFAATRISSAVWEYPQTFLHTTDTAVIAKKTDILWDILPRIASYMWIIGVAVMLIYAMISYLRLYLITRESIKSNNNVFLCDKVASPFILGIFRPRIILPFDTPEQDLLYILAHERAHIRRRDHLWKPFGYLLLSVYWFNPLLWIAYILLCRDIEAACDERVIRELGIDCKKSYANALINSAAPKRLITACPVAFGETSVKARVKNILSYKKPAFWIIIIAVLLSIVTAVCFLTDPISKNSDSASGKLNAEYIWSYFTENVSEQDAQCEVRLLINNGLTEDIAVDMCNFKLYKNSRLLTPSYGDDILYYNYFDSGKSGAPLFNLYPYISDLDTSSTFRIEADCYSYEKTDAPDVDGEYAPKVSNKPVATMSVDFKFPTAEEQGDMPNHAYDIIETDIDGDGYDEIITLSYGPTSGRYSFTIGAYDKNHHTKYEPYTMYDLCDEWLSVNSDGQPLLICADPYNSASLSYFIEANGDKLTLTANDISYQPGAYTDDIEGLTAATDMPYITYADDRYVYLDGDCGVTVYDLKEEKLVFRIPLSQLQHLGFESPYSVASDDGKYIIIKNRDESMNTGNTSLIMSVETGDIVALNSDEEVNKYKTFVIGNEGYDIKYDETGKNISERRYISGNKRYKLVVPGWVIKNTELTVTDLQSDTEKTYHIFE